MSSRIDKSHYFETKEDQQRSLTFYPFLDLLLMIIGKGFEQEKCSLITAVGKLHNFEAEENDLKILSKKL